MPDLPLELVLEPLPEIFQDHGGQILDPGHQGRGRERPVPLFIAQDNGGLVTDGFEIRSVGQLMGIEAAEPPEKIEGG